MTVDAFINKVAVIKHTHQAKDIDITGINVNTKLFYDLYNEMRLNVDYYYRIDNNADIKIMGLKIYKTDDIPENEIKAVL